MRMKKLMLAAVLLGMILGAGCEVLTQKERDMIRQAEKNKQLKEEEDAKRWAEYVVAETARREEIKRVEAERAANPEPEPEPVKPIYTAFDLVRDLKLGMTTEEVRNLLSPWDINRTVTPTGVQEQWIYPWEKYLYFIDGKLIMWQE